MITGIGKEMHELSQINSSLPYLLTIFVAVVFFIFGLYGLSADNQFRKLPYLKQVIFIIAGIFIFRGMGELIFDVVSKTIVIFNPTRFRSIQKYFYTNSLRPRGCT